MVFSKCICLCHCLFLCICLCNCPFFCSGHVSSSVWSNVSKTCDLGKVTSLWDSLLRVFAKCIPDCLCHRHCYCHRHCLFIGEFLSPHHSHQTSQRSPVSWVALWWCSLNVFVFLIIFFWSGHVSSSPWSNISKLTSLWDRSLKVLFECICLCHCLCLCICHCHCLFYGQVMSHHHSDQMSQRSQVPRTALWRCSLNVFVIVIVFVFVIVFFLVRSCLLITLIKCFKGHKCLGLLFEGVR